MNQKQIILNKTQFYIEEKNENYKSSTNNKHKKGNIKIIIKNTF